MFLESGVKPIDYNSLLDDKKYVNMILHRKHFRKQTFNLKTECLNHTEFIIGLIEDELKKRK